MNELTAVVIGATGLTGNLLVEELLKDNAFKTVRVLVRRHLHNHNPKLQQEIVNFNDTADYAAKFGEGDVIFCCIGTTQKKVKNDKMAYEKIDLDIPVNAARIGIDKGFKKFLIVSAIGANENASNFYLKLKGKIENKLKEFAYQSISIFRPSLLLGPREEYRLGEKIARVLTEIFSFLFFGFLEKYHPVDAEKVAIAMVKQSKLSVPGTHYFTYAEIIDLTED